MPEPEIAWGKRVSPEFKTRVLAICDGLGCDPSHLMAAMVFETGERFTPDVQNPTSKAPASFSSCPRRQNRSA